MMNTAAVESIDVINIGGVLINEILYTDNLARVKKWW